MNLQARYDQLWQVAAAQLSQGTCDLDPLLDATADTRRGITLLARPPAPVLAAIQELLQPLRQLEPEQYFYPATDVHLTVLSIVSCCPGFSLSQIDVSAYVEAVRTAIEKVPAFRLQFRGVTASPGTVMVQGFVEGRELSMLRENLRKVFQAGALAHSIDSRYPLQTAHSTVVRFRQPLQQPQNFLNRLQAMRATDLGTWWVKDLELVFNDWYQRQATTHLLATFPLPLS